MAHAGRVNNYGLYAIQIGTVSRLIDSLGGKLELIAHVSGGEIRLKLVGE